MISSKNKCKLQFSICLCKNTMLGRVTKLIPFIFILFNLGDSQRKEPTYGHEGYYGEGHLVVDSDTAHQEYHTFSATDVKFYMYDNPGSSGSRHEAILITSDNINLLVKTRPTKIIVHGLGGYENQFWIDQMVANYHAKGNYNIIAVDWSKHTVTDQFFAVSAVNEVGEVVSEFIIQITEENLELMQDIHLIGSDHGAHVGGVAGRKIKEKTNSTVNRITGLDPTVLDKNANVTGLSEDDAEFVDVVRSEVIGYESNFGTANFYVTSDNPNTMICNGSCTHVGAPEMFVWTIIDGHRYEAVPCENETAYVQKLCQNNTRVPMGEYVPRNVSGTFYLSTDSASGLKGTRFILAITCALIVFSLFGYY